MRAKHSVSLIKILLNRKDIVTLKIKPEYQSEIRNSNIHLTDDWEGSALNKDLKVMTLVQQT